MRLWVEINNLTCCYCPNWSASSWGCELKYNLPGKLMLTLRQPLREAVSWNDDGHNKLTIGACQPLREAVSWNKSLKCNIVCYYRQPLREAVSWNSSLHATHTICPEVSLFVRLWVEISCLCYCFSVAPVSLFVRLWVEMSGALDSLLPGSLSASSWGCELK